jgi:uncharacterized lipoprotein YajG
MIQDIRSSLHVTRLVFLLVALWCLAASFYPRSPPTLSPPVATQHQETSCSHNL